MKKNKVKKFMSQAGGVRGVTIVLDMLRCYMSKKILELTNLNDSERNLKNKLFIY